ncbi:MAG TPA: YggT family protein [Alphaproteobacteria bacterium]|nr:YggT family protein [Alphaproteobacteria bacterium]
MSGNPFWQHWYFHLPNYALAALVYTMLGRFLLSLVLRPDTQNYIQRWFVRLTEPVIRIVRSITPAMVPHGVLPLVAAIWLTLLRVMLLVLFLRAGGPTD